MVVLVVMSWTLGNTFPMMQRGPRWAAHALGVVRETGGTGRITGCERQHVNVNGFPRRMIKCIVLNLKMSELSLSECKSSL